MDTKLESGRMAEGMNSLFEDLQELFEDYFKAASARCDLEDFAGKDVKKDNKKLSEILDGLHNKLAPLLQPNANELSPNDVIALIDAISALLTFSSNKGPIKPEIKAKLTEIISKKNAEFSENRLGSDKKMLILSIAGMALEACTMNFLRSAIFGLNAYIANDMVRLDEVVSQNSEAVDVAYDPLNILAKNSGRKSPQVFALMNKYRSLVLAAGMTFMSINTAWTFVENFSNQSSSTVENKTVNKVSDARKLENILMLVFSYIQMAISLSAISRYVLASQTNHSINYAVYQQFKIEELESKWLNGSQLKALNRLLEVLKAALTDMSKDSNYNPMPLIQQIQVALEAVTEGENINVAKFIDAGKKATHDQSKQQAVVGVAQADLQPRESTRARLEHVLVMPVRKDKLTRAERRELYELNRREAAQNDVTAAVQAQPPQATLNPVATPAPAPEITELLLDRTLERLLSLKGCKRVRILLPIEHQKKFKRQWDQLFRQLGFDANNSLEVVNFDNLNATTDTESPVIVTRKMNTHVSEWDRSRFSKLMILEVTPARLLSNHFLKKSN